jgi:hypothetical protein
MANPKVKKGKSGAENDSIQAQKLRQLKRGNGGDGGVITEKTVSVMRKKKK